MKRLSFRERFSPVLFLGLSFFLSLPAGAAETDPYWYVNSTNQTMTKAGTLDACRLLAIQLGGDANLNCRQANCDGFCMSGAGCERSGGLANGTCIGGYSCCKNDNKNGAVTPAPVLGKCTGFSTKDTTKVQGVCKDSCASGTERQDGTCPAESGSASAGKKCCVSVSSTSSVSSGMPVDPTASVSFGNPLGFDTVQGAVDTFLSAFQGIIVWLALLFLVLGGILYVTSAGNPKNIEKAKAMITAAMIGLAIGVAAPSFLKEIGTVLGWGGAEVPAGVGGAKSVTQVVQGALNFLLSISGLLAILMMVIGGLMYFAAAGDEKRADTAKEIVKYAVIGIAVVATSLIIIRTVAMLFTGSSAGGTYY